MIAYIYIILLFILTSGEVTFRMAIVLFLTTLKHMLIGVKAYYINGNGYGGWGFTSLLLCFLQHAECLLIIIHFTVHVFVKTVSMSVYILNIG